MSESWTMSFGESYCEGKSVIRIDERDDSMTDRRQ